MKDKFKICPVCKKKMDTLWLTDYDAAVSEYYLKGWKCNEGCGSEFFWRSEDRLESFTPEQNKETIKTNTDKSSKDYSEAKSCPICKEKLLILSSVNYKNPGCLNMLGWHCGGCLNNFPKDTVDKLEKYIHPEKIDDEFSEDYGDSGVLNEIPESLPLKVKKPKNKGKNIDNVIRLESLDELDDIMALNDILNADVFVDVDALLEEKSAEVLKGIQSIDDTPDEEVRNPWGNTSLFTSL